MVDLLLIGTVHRDPEGHDKLLSILHGWNPDYLTLEMSPYAVQFRRKKRLALRQRVDDTLQELVWETPDLTYPEVLYHPAIRNVLAVVDFPYEYMAISSFSRSRHVPFQCIDSSDFSKKKLSILERDLISKKNLWTLLQLRPCEVYQEINQEYSLASMSLRWGQKVGTRARNGHEQITRDRYMAKTIRKLLSSLRVEKLVHIGGWEHLVDDGKNHTLSTLLSDLRPQRLFLPQSPIGDPSRTSTPRPGPPLP